LKSPELNRCIDIIRKTIILGIGNLLLGDEGAGVHIINRLKAQELPPHVRLIDGATGGFSLIPVFEKYKNDKFIIIDAIKIFDEGNPDDVPPDNAKKGDLYFIPLYELYNSTDTNYENPEFISFHQTAIFDVLLLLFRTFKIKIKGYFLGINIFDPSEELHHLDSKYTMELSPEIKGKISKAIEIIRKNI
jgi:hydrogenase maturation protease